MKFDRLCPIAGTKGKGPFSINTSIRLARKFNIEVAFRILIIKIVEIVYFAIKTEKLLLDCLLN